VSEAAIWGKINASDKIMSEKHRKRENTKIKEILT